MKKKLLITTQNDFKFPLAEAGRRQIFLEALKLKEKNIEPTVLVIVDNDKVAEELIKDDICIKIFRKKDIFKIFFTIKDFKEIFYFGTCDLFSLLTTFVFFRKNKKIIFSDGGIFSRSKMLFLRKMILLLHNFSNIDIFYYTSYQEKILKRYLFPWKKMMKKNPLIENSDILKIKKEEQPTILYMGHFSKFKGINIIVEVFKRLVVHFPELRLVLANNQVKEEVSLYKEIERLKKRFPTQVVLKGKINPYYELQKAWVYLYPVQTEKGTHAFPFSIYEAIQCTTPFVSSHVGGVSEYFLEEFLCDTGNINEYYSKTKKILSNYTEYKDKMNEQKEVLETKVEKI